MIEQEESFVWWKHGIIYHIYPQSFYDTNADGTGDLQGIIQKLDYLKELGIDAIWLSPIYKSPLIDGGYDISDFYSINPVYGTMQDFRELLEKAHSYQIKVIMDIVLNHTSSRHPWFKLSSSSKDNSKRNWYIWHDNLNEKKPNNWRTNFWKTAWTLDKVTDEYYYHSFFQEQPDLNWRNPEVKKAMFEMIKFWLDLGIDGIRLDVINLIFKDKSLRNNSILHLLSGKKAYNRNQPEVYKLLKDLRILLSQYKDKASIGEIYAPPPGNSSLVNSFLGNGENMLHLAFDFSLVFSPFNAKQYYKIIRNYYQSLPDKSWPCFFISNHDIGRNLKRYFFSRYKFNKAKVLAAMLLTLKGSPFIYYGDEIGMENTPLKRKNLRDRYGKMFYPFYKGRDKMRTPMQWNSDEHAGFSETSPWLPVNSNYQYVNVEKEKENPDSLYNLFEKLIKIRKQHKALHMGDIKFINSGNNNLLLYMRYINNEKIMIILNFSFIRRKTQKLTLGRNYDILFSNDNRKPNQIGTERLTLNPFEIIIIKINAD